MTRTERQFEILKKWVANKCKGTACCCTGFGKTHTALTAVDLVIAKNPKVNVVIVVPTKVLKDQWLSNIEERRIEANIAVLVLNTAASKPFNCDFLIIDECHRANSLTFRELFNQCSPSFILGLTATYERLDNYQKEVLDKYCPVCDTVTLEEAVENGWLSQHKQYKVMLDVDLTEYEKANVVFLQHFAFFGYDFKLAMECCKNLWKQQVLARQMNCTVTEVKAHAYAWNRALRFRKTFIANHPKKLEIAKKIIAARENKKIITFNSSIKQCEAYGNGYIVHSGNSKKKNQMSLEEFARCTTGIIHSSQMLKEGLDCPGLSVAIITGFNSSKIERVQMTGRCIRFEKNKEAEIFTLVLRNTVEDKWFQKSSESMTYIEINESELDKVLNGEDISKKTKKGFYNSDDILRL